LRASLHAIGRSGARARRFNARLHNDAQRSRPHYRGNHKRHTCAGKKYTLERHDYLAAAAFPRASNRVADCIAEFEISFLYRVIQISSSIQIRMVRVQASVKIYIIQPILSLSHRNKAIIASSFNVNLPLVKFRSSLRDMIFAQWR